MSDILSEIVTGHGLTLSQAAIRFPSYRRGRPVSLGCVARWVIDGVRGPDGQRVHLEAARLSNRWITTPQAIARFIGAQTPTIAAPGTPTPAPRSPSVRQRASERAARQLEAVGI